MHTRLVIPAVLLLAALLAPACSPAAEPPPQDAAATAAPSADAPTPAVTSTAPTGTPSTGALTFEREVDGLRQRLELRPQGENAFDVTLTAAGSCSRSEAGPATAVAAEGDGDVEVDPDGEGHPVDTFTLAGANACRLSIRLAAPDRNYAWVRETDCSTACPLTTRAMGRR